MKDTLKRATLDDNVVYLFVGENIICDMKFEIDKRRSICNAGNYSKELQIPGILRCSRTNQRTSER